MLKTTTHRLYILCFWGWFGIVANPVCAQTPVVTGRITTPAEDPFAAKSVPLAGVSVRWQGMTTGTATDTAGRYQLTRPVKRPAILLISSVGFAARRMVVADQTEVNATLLPLIQGLAERVVTASRQPVRKLETTTAVEVLPGRDIRDRTPATFADALRYVPGLYTQTATGRYGGQIFVRGFPDGTSNGLVYTSVLIDGLPTLASPGRPVDEFFKLDPTTDRIEVVRGSAATLFGRSSAAGVINVITKTGGEKLAGTVTLSHYSNVFGTGLNPRVDVVVGGPVIKAVRFSVGGFYLHDTGYRNSGYPDKGGQVRANLDWLLPRGGSVRVFGGYTNTVSQNHTEIPYRLSDLTVADGWTARDTYYTPAYESIQYTVTTPQSTTQSRSAGDVYPAGNYARGYQMGATLNLPLGHGWTLIDRFRYQNVTTGLSFALGVAPFFTLTPPTTPGTINTTNLHLLLDGASGNVDQINEFRLEKEAETGRTKHHVSIGTYYSAARLTPTYYSYAYYADVVPRGRVFGFVPPAYASPTTGSLARSGDYHEETLSFFAGDDVKINPRLTINAGVRHDQVRLNLAETLPPLTLPGIPRDPALPAVVTNTRAVTARDFSASLGVNYRLSARTAFYGNAVRAFRAPDYSAYTTLRRVAVQKTVSINGADTPVYGYDPNAAYTVLPTGLEKNETILNAELGYRAGFGPLSVDATVFGTRIDHRLATTYIDGIAVTRPVGNNVIAGTELALTYTPATVPGLVLRSSLTTQNARFAAFDIALSPGVVVFDAVGKSITAVVDPLGNLYGNTLKRLADGTGRDATVLDLRGNKLPGVPELIWNGQVSYTRKHVGLDARLNYVGSRFQDPTNVIRLPAQVFTEAGFSYRVAGIGGRVQVQNLFNSQTLTRMLGNEADQALVQKQVNPAFTSVVGQGFPLLPRRVIYSVSYSF